MCHFKVTIEIINNPKDTLSFNSPSIEKAEFTVNENAKIDEMIEKYIRLLGVMGWVPEDYLEKLEEYFDSVERYVKGD